MVNISTIIRDHGNKTDKSIKEETKDDAIIGDAKEEGKKTDKEVKSSIRTKARNRIEETRYDR